MYKSPSYDLQTYKSIELESLASHIQSEKSSSNNNKAQHFFIDKIESYLSLMEKQFTRNIQWQKQMLKDFKDQKKNRRVSQKKIQSKDKDAHSKRVLKLGQDEEMTLKKILRKSLNIEKENMNLMQMVKLATSLQCKQRKYMKSQQRYSEEYYDVIEFPIMPQVITLNDLAPSTHQNLSSNKASPIKDSKLKIPKYQYNKKSPNQLFSAEILSKKQQESQHKYPFKSPSKSKESDFEYNIFNPQKQIKIELQDSLGKRLCLNGHNIVTFKELERQQQKKSSRSSLSQLQKISLSLSQSQQVYCEQKRNRRSNAGQECQSFQLLTSNRSNRTQKGNNYILIRENKHPPKEESKQYVKVSHEEQLSFNEFKKRKIGRYTDRQMNQPKQSNFQWNNGKNANFYKKMHDSFGNLYHQIPMEKEERRKYEESKRSIYGGMIYQTKIIE